MSDNGIKELQLRLAKTRTQNGFNVVDETNLQTKIGCVMCELDELEIELENGSYDRALIECADVWIYALIICLDFDYDWPLRSHIVSRPGHPLHLKSEVFSHLRDARHSAVKAFEYWRRSEIKDALMSLQLCCLDVGRIAFLLDPGRDLFEVIEEKDEYNRTRGKLHGGKHPDS